MYQSSNLKSGQATSSEDKVSQRRNEEAGRTNTGTLNDVTNAVQASTCSKCIQVDSSDLDIYLYRDGLG